MLRRYAVAGLLALSLAACGAQEPLVEVDPAQVEEDYQRCLDEGGSFTKTPGGFSCTIPK